MAKNPCAENVVVTAWSNFLFRGLDFRCSVKQRKREREIKVTAKLKEGKGVTTIKGRKSHFFFFKPHNLSNI